MTDGCTNLKMQIEELGNGIGQEVADLILWTCAEQDIPKQLHSTLARVVARSVSLSVLNSLDVVREVNWFEQYGDS